MRVVAQSDFGAIIRRHDYLSVFGRDNAEPIAFDTLTRQFVGRNFYPVDAVDKRELGKPVRLPRAEKEENSVSVLNSVYFGILAREVDRDRLRRRTPFHTEC